MSTNEKIQQLVHSLTKSLNNENEKLAIPILATKLDKYIALYPEDKTLGGISQIIDKMSANNKLFIRKAEFNTLYNKLYTNQTKFAEIFQEELGITSELSTIKTYQRDDSVHPLDTYQIADPILSNALSSVFEKTPLKMYSQLLANKAITSVAGTLDAWNLKPTSLSVDQGNDKFLMIKADYETPKGITSFYVPLEINNHKVSEASVFLGNHGSQDLNHLNIKKYLTTNAGVKLKIDATSMLGLMAEASSQNREISNVEMAMIKARASKQQAEFFQHQIVGQKIEEQGIKDVQLPKYLESKIFDKSFNSPHGLAALQFGEDKVATGREHIIRELISCGYKNSQVVVTGCDDKTIFYGVSLDLGKVGFLVPLKLVQGKLTKPSCIMCNGSISSFDQQGINQLYLENKSDLTIAAVASPSYHLKPNELINNIKQALYEGNHDKAEDSLNVLANSGDEKAYAIGFSIFLQGLSQNEKPIIGHQTTCNLLLKNATSTHQICGHTNLPIHKVYQDNHGNCRPLYRKGMEENYQGAYFMNHKIFG